jgi:hypothetical protein
MGVCGPAAKVSLITKRQTIRPAKRADFLILFLLNKKGVELKVYLLTTYVLQ